MKKQLEMQLVEAIKRLDTAAEKLVSTSGYTHETRKLKLLAELIKEQIKNENTVSTTGEIR